MPTDDLAARQSGPARHRRRALKGDTPAPPATVMIPVQRVGRHRWRDYCERCGQKRRACQCEATA